MSKHLATEHGGGSAGACSDEDCFPSEGMSWSQTLNEDKRSQDASIEDQSDGTRGTELESPCFESRSPSGSSASSVPPPADDLDRTLRHIGMQEFGKSLDIAARAMFPNDTACRYNKVYVLLITWKTQDPKLPVTVELCRLRSVFKDIYHYEVEEFEIPDDDSHAETSEMINAFVKLNKNSRDDLKIVYYAGHGRLSPTKELIWYPEPERKNHKSPRVKWSGIQTSLEMAKSDVLMLLDCCSSGVVHASDGNGIMEMICACGYDSTANGVGPYSFTHELTTELRLLSNKPTFTVGALYSAVYTRMQSHMKQGVANERYPSPMHFVFAPENSFNRSISLSARKPDAAKPNKSVGDSNKLSCLQDKVVYPVPSARHTNKRRRLDHSEMASSSSIVDTESGQSNTEALATYKCISTKSPSSVPSDSAKEQKDTADCPLKDSLYPHDAPRALFLVRLKEDIAPENLSLDLFKDWMSSCPAAVDEIRIEASYKCFSTLVLITMPFAMQAYMPKRPAIMALGAVKSSICVPFEKKTRGSQVHETESNDKSLAQATKRPVKPLPNHQDDWATTMSLSEEQKQHLSANFAASLDPQELITLLDARFQTYSKFSKLKCADLSRQLKHLIRDEQLYGGDLRSELDCISMPMMDRALTVSDESVRTDFDILPKWLVADASSPTADTSLFDPDPIAFSLYPEDDAGNYQDSWPKPQRWIQPSGDWREAFVPPPVYGSTGQAATQKVTGREPPDDSKTESKEASLYHPWHNFTPSIPKQQSMIDPPHTAPSRSAASEPCREREQVVSRAGENTARDHHLYHNVKPRADGLYHCPWENDPQANCLHRPEKLKCNYDKFVDSHLKPYRCQVVSCQDMKFSSTACVLRHEREAHGLHGHGEKPFLCTYEGCERSVPGNGFPRHWNLKDHLKRVHDNPGSRYNSRTPSPHRKGPGKTPKPSPGIDTRPEDEKKISDL